MAAPVIAVVVLAAGAGTRLGGAKALASLAGQTLLERVVATCSGSLADEIIVVAGAQGDEVATAVQALARTPEAPSLRCLQHADWARGRTGSLQAGWLAAGDAAHVLVFPVDHPVVRLVTLDVVLGVHGYAGRAPEAVIPVVEQAGLRRRGHPVLLSAALRQRVLALGPDEPLHSVVRSCVALEVPVDDDGILLNVDVPEDLAAAQRLLAERGEAC